MATPVDTNGVARDGAKIAVIGAGYVGIPTAVLLSHFGHQVVVAERDPHRREALQAGRSPIMEEGVEEILSQCLASGRLTFVDDATVAVKDAQFVFLCVATPTGSEGQADLTQIDAAVLEIGPHLAPGAVVVNKSTVPVGTAERVAGLLERNEISVVSNPEFLREGTAVRDSFSPDRTVVGSNNADAANAVGALFSPTGAPLHLTDARTAELIKYAANAFLATKISYINSIAQLCDAVGADVIDLVRGVGLDPRIGSAFFNPGPGWGGSCLPKDASALLSIARDAGVGLPIVQAAVEANSQAQNHIVDRVRELVGGSLGAVRIAVLGLSFKAKTSDRRDSPALAVSALLISAGARVVAFDPTVSAGSSDSDLDGIETVSSPLEAARGAHAVIVLTEWAQFGELDFVQLGEAVAQRVIYDARNIIDVAAATAAGFRTSGVGRP
jgi:UDPglucose 6-dehydrogenase